MIISWNGITSAGRVKPVNQDSVYFAVTPDKECGIFVVADGVGGLDSGEVASRTAVEETEKWWNVFSAEVRNVSTEATVDALSNLVFEINGKIQKINIENDKKSATTFSLLLIVGNRYFIAHVGDSRVYALDKSNDGSLELLQATRDHTKAGWREVNGRRFMQNMLTDGLGYKKSINCDCSFGVLNEETGGFLLCSDGVYKRQNETLIAGTITANVFDPSRVCEELIYGAMRLGENDNITAILVNVN